MQNMHEWEVMCNDIAKQNELSFEEQFNKQKELRNRIVFSVSDVSEYFRAHRKFMVFAHSDPLRFS